MKHFLLSVASAILMMVGNIGYGQGIWGPIERVTNDNLSQFLPAFDSAGKVWYWQRNPASTDPNRRGYLVCDQVIATTPHNGEIDYNQWLLSGSNLAYIVVDTTVVPEGLRLYKNGLPLLSGLSDATDGIPGYRSFLGMSFAGSGEFACFARYGMSSGYITLSQPDRMDLVNNDGTTTSLCQFSPTPSCDGSFGTKVPYQALGMIGGEWWYWVYDWLTGEQTFVSRSGQTIPQPPLDPYQGRIIGDKLFVLVYGDSGGLPVSQLWSYDFSSGTYEQLSDSADYVTYWACDGQMLAYVAADLVSDKDSIKVRFAGVSLPAISAGIKYVYGLDVQGNTLVWSSSGPTEYNGEIYKATWQPTNAVGDSWGLYE